MSNIQSTLAVVMAVLSGTVAAARADGRPVRIDSIGFKHAVYDVSSGSLRPMSGAARGSNKLWSCNDFTGYFLPAGNCVQPDPNYPQVDALLTDWGDLDECSTIEAFTVSYATNANADPNAVQLTIFFGDNANGFDDNDPNGTVAGFVANLPGRPPGFPYQFVAWSVTFQLTGAGAHFALGDSDLDADGRLDFSYSYGFLGAAGYGDSTLTGPLIVEPNDPLLSAGAEDAYDVYQQDPNNPCSDPNALFAYAGTFWFGGAPSGPFAQFPMVLYGTPGAPGCPIPGCAEGDLDGDCMVGLADLSDLLENFGCMSADACYDANADIDGDGTNGLGDLSALLEQFGTNCNVPGPRALPTLDIDVESASPDCCKNVVFSGECDPKGGIVYITWKKPNGEWQYKRQASCTNDGTYEVTAKRSDAPALRVFRASQKRACEEEASRSGEVASPTCEPAADCPN